MTSRAVEGAHPSCRLRKAESEVGARVDAGFEEAMRRHAEAQGERPGGPASARTERDCRYGLSEAVSAKE